MHFIIHHAFLLFVILHGLSFSQLIVSSFSSDANTGNILAQNWFLYSQNHPENHFVCWNHLY